MLLAPLAKIGIFNQPYKCLESLALGERDQLSSAHPPLAGWPLQPVARVQDCTYWRPDPGVCSLALWAIFPAGY